MRKQYNRKPHFTKEQLEIAKSVPLLPFLKQRGYQFKKQGNEYRMVNHDSFVVSNNLWKWYSRAIGGDVISFLTRVEGMDVVSAVLHLCGEQNAGLASKRVPDASRNSDISLPFLLPERNSTSRHAFAYLLKTRCIDRDIIGDLIRKGKIYESLEYLVSVKTDDDSYAWAKLVKNSDFDLLEKAEIIQFRTRINDDMNMGLNINGKIKYIGTPDFEKETLSELLEDARIAKINPILNCVFCGFDENGDIKYASMRGIQTGSTFRQDIIGSRKKYCFNMEGKSNEIYVFEAPIDAISHATLFKLNGFDWRADSRVALGGVSELALDQFLKTHTGISKITFCLDRDEAGINNVYGVTDKETGEVRMRSLLEKYESLGYEVSASFPATKDYNSDLIELCNTAMEPTEKAL